MAKLLISYGMAKSASTFAWQLIKQIALTGGLPVATLTVVSKGNHAPEDYIETLSAEKLQLIRKDIGERVGVIKTHSNVTSAAVKLIEDGDAILFASYRDPRDISLSLIDHGNRSRKLGISDFAQIHTIQDSILTLREQIKRFEAWVKACSPILLSYDELCFDTAATAGKIVRVLGVDVDPEEIANKFISDKSKIGQFNKGERQRHRNELDFEQNERLVREFPNFYRTYFPAEIDRIERGISSGKAFQSDLRCRVDLPKILSRKQAVGESVVTEVNEQMVANAYRYILGREPESSSVVETKIRTCKNFSELRLSMLRSKEFQAKIEQIIGKKLPHAVPLSAPPMDVEVATEPGKLAAMIANIERNWAKLGASEPHWSVLTNERYRKELIGENAEEFYASGQNVINDFIATVGRASGDLSGLQTCFELGCGVGRLTVWLAKSFKKVIAADISQPHLHLAREAAAERGINNIKFQLLNKISEIERLPRFDCFVSIIVLQHNPPPVIGYMLKILFEKLKPGGFAYFQVPTYKANTQFRVQEYLDDITDLGRMEMHALPQAEIWRLADNAGCKLVDIREDNRTANPQMVSNTILIQKPWKDSNRNKIR